MSYYTAAGCQDRWYDKIFGLIIFRNGKISGVLEHTPCDAPIILAWVDQTATKLRTQTQTVNSTAVLKLENPQKLIWQITAQQKCDLVEARNQHLQKAATMDYFVIQFTDFGTNTIKECNSSPDAIIQLTLNLAYYTLHNDIPATY